MKRGENGRGIRSRWYPGTLASRFEQMRFVVDRMLFRQTDGLKVIEEYAGREDALFFIDPPCTAGGKRAGRRLYRHSDLDHERLFELCADLRGDFLMTYDNADEVGEMARRYGFDTRLVPMKNTHHATMDELVAGRDLAWIG